jgi:hypothetical protein
MRRRGKIEKLRLARDVLAEHDGDFHLFRRRDIALDKFAEADDRALLVRNLDADGVLPGIGATMRTLDAAT